MAEYRIEMAFSWNFPTSFLLVAEAVKTKYLQQYQEIADEVGATLDGNAFYPLQNGLVKVSDSGTKGTPQWLTKLQSGNTLAYYFFDNTRDQEPRKLALPIIAFTSTRQGDPRSGQADYPLPPIDANRSPGGTYQNPWQPELSDPEPQNPAIYTSSPEESFVWASELPSWNVTSGGTAEIPLVRSGLYDMSTTVGVLGTGGNGPVMRIYGFDPEVIVGPGSSG